MDAPDAKPQAQEDRHGGEEGHWAELGHLPYPDQLFCLVLM